MTKRLPARYKRSSSLAAGKGGAGFTLLETIVYIALSGLILTGMLGTVYPILSGADRVSVNVTTQGETAFVLRKVSWALSSAASPTPIATPSAGGSGDTLVVNKFPSGIVTIRQNGDAIEVDGTPITASRVKIANFRVEHVSPLSGVPRYIELEFDANGKHVGPVRNYLRF